MYFSKEECYNETYLSLTLGVLAEEDVRHLMKFYEDTEHYECCAGIALAYKEYKEKKEISL